MADPEPEPYQHRGRGYVTSIWRATVQHVGSVPTVNAVSLPLFVLPVLILALCTIKNTPRNVPCPQRYEACFSAPTRDAETWLSRAGKERGGLLFTYGSARNGHLTFTFPAKYFKSNLS
jgi:hypothetical protein